MTDLEIPSAPPAMVTGANGYVASWLVKRLLEEGATVHATVRDPGDPAKVAHLEAMAEDAPGTLRIFAGDLLEPGSFTEAMAGCGVVFHTASPFTSKISDPQRDLVDPALLGTRNVLSSVNDTESVDRVVLTSSVAAIYGDARDIADAPGEVLTEEQWNTTSSLDHLAYPYSKTVAEKAAWEMAHSQARWKLVTINPSLVLGPSLSGQPTSESFNLLAMIGGGEAKIGAPPLELGLVDVRDVAEAHLRAGYLDAVEGRHIVSGEPGSLLDLAEMLRTDFADWPLPERELPKAMVWTVGPILSKQLSRGYVARNMGYPFRADNSKAREALGVEFRPVAPGVREMFAQMVETGQVTR